jgi:pimeloyl-ACP methyl ester carboxylesterase
MMNTRIALSVISVAAAALVGVSSVGLAQAGQSPPRADLLRKGYVSANGVNYYYEIHGQGEPLLLLHGGLSSIEMFRPSLAVFAKRRQVIALDLYGHGRTALTSRPISPHAIGDDLAVVLEQLGYDSVDVLGYSMGGAVALRLAVQHPRLVRRLALLSTVFAQHGFFPELLLQQAAMSAAIADAMKDTPLYRTYQALAPRPQDFPRLLDRMGEWMRTPFDWSEDVRRLEGPVLLIYADADNTRPEHIVRFYQLLGGGLRDAGWQREHMPTNRLAILPGYTHYDVLLAPELPATVLAFVDGDKDDARSSLR